MISRAQKFKVTLGSITRWKDEEVGDETKKERHTGCSVVFHINNKYFLVKVCSKYCSIFVCVCVC